MKSGRINMHEIRSNSLALRLFLSATAWTVVILAATGVLLSSIYRNAAERSFASSKRTVVGSVTSKLDRNCVASSQC